MNYCCTNCFSNDNIKNYIVSHNRIGECDYCGSKNVFTISTEDIGMFFRDCFSKAYETIESGTGAYYDPEDRDYNGPSGSPVTNYSTNVHHDRTRR